MSKEKQIEDFENDLRECHTEFSVSDDSMDLYTDYKITAQNMIGKGWRKQSEWISVEERLPEPNTHVLIYVFFHNQWQIVKGWHSYCDKKFHIANSDYPSLTDVPVTHWMPLPEAPKMKGGEEG